MIYYLIENYKQIMDKRAGWGLGSCWGFVGAWLEVLGEGRYSKLHSKFLTQHCLQY